MIKMNCKELFAGITICLYIQFVYSDILELGEDEQGMPVWKNGEYRDRNEIPMPPNYDEDKKHKRDASEDSLAVEGEISQKTTKKNLINRGSGKKGKKSSIPDSKRTRSDRLKLDDMLEYGKLDVQTPDRRSHVSKTWGMTYDNVFQDEPKVTTGQSRSKLEAGYKIKEEDLDDGMMFRGLGGLKLRDQNHQIIDGKFAEEESDEEMNARSDVSQTKWRRDLFHFNHLFNHHHHRPHQHHYNPSGPRGHNRHNHNNDNQQQQQQQYQNQQPLPNQPQHQQNSQQQQQQTSQQQQQPIHQQQQSNEQQQQPIPQQQQQSSQQQQQPIQQQQQSNQQQQQQGQ